VPFPRGTLVLQLHVLCGIVPHIGPCALPKRDSGHTVTCNTRREAHNMNTTANRVQIGSGTTQPNTQWILLVRAISQAVRWQNSETDSSSLSGAAVRTGRATSPYVFMACCLINKYQGYLRQSNSVALVRERIIPTERPSLEISVNFCGYIGVAWSARRIPTIVISDF
jgi:hypothetical protein